ncbi:unnamed protein product, partial [Mesorhabditis spiculigera]
MKLLLLFAFFGAVSMYGLVCDECENPGRLAFDDTVKLGELVELPDGCLRLPVSCKNGKKLLFNGKLQLAPPISLKCHMERWYYEPKDQEVWAITCKPPKNG